MSYVALVAVVAAVTTATTGTTATTATKHNKVAAVAVAVSLAAVAGVAAVAVAVSLAVNSKEKRTNQQMLKKRQKLELPVLDICSQPAVTAIVSVGVTNCREVC